MLALLLRNLRHQRWLLLALALGMVGLEAMLIHIAVGFDEGPGIAGMVEFLPALLRKFLETQIADIADMSFAAFAAFGFQHPGVLVACTAYAMLAGTIPAGDRDAGTLDLFLARPLPRSHYLGAALGCIVLGALLLPAALLAGAALGLGTIADPAGVRWTRYTGAALQLGALLASFGGVALLITSFGGRRGSVIAQTVGLILALYMLEILAEMSPLLASARWISPFHYFKPIRTVMATPGADGNALVLLSLAAVTSTLAFLRFGRRDI